MHSTSMNTIGLKEQYNYCMWLVHALTLILHRKHQEDFEHYTREQRLLINHTIAETIDYLRTEWTSTLGIEDYLWHD